MMSCLSVSRYSVVGNLQYGTVDIQKTHSPFPPGNAHGLSELKRKMKNCVTGIVWADWVLVFSAAHMDV